MPVTWESEITEWEPPLFTDSQIHGPYKQWVHRHLFEETADGTLVIDQVTYRPPGGALVNRLFVVGELKRIFSYRRAKLLEIYSGVGRRLSEGPKRMRQISLQV